MDNEAVMKSEIRVTLRTVAERVGLTPGTISAVLNNSRGADRIPQHTRERVLAAARELNYSPNPLARALRSGKALSTRADDRDTTMPRGALVIIGVDQFERALNAIQQAGLRVPDDVSFLGFSDALPAWEHASLAAPPQYPS